MNKGELVTRLSSVMNVTHREASTVVDAFIESVLESIKKDGRVCLMGFGSFRRRERKSRTARNPRTGEKIQVGDKIVPHFTPGKDLLAAVNPGDTGR